MTNDQPDDGPTMDEFESFLVNNAHLDEIRAHLGKFNPIKTMGMERMEIRHSAILRWLMDPQETHGLGDRFLKAFLSQALRGYEGSETPTALELSQADLSDAIIEKEWRNIDLLVLSPRKGWIFIIENKFDSSQHSNQLKKYYSDVTNTFRLSGNYSCIRGVFLSLQDETPEDPRYATITYQDVAHLIEQVALSGRIPLAAEVEIFIKHYLEIVLEATGMSSEREKMKKLAKELYRDHRKVLDFIMENGQSTEFLLACDAVFQPVEGEGKKRVAAGEIVVPNFVSGEIYGFIPKKWYDALGGGDAVWQNLSNYWGGLPVAMWLRLYPGKKEAKGQLGLYAEVGPIRDYSTRLRFIEKIEEAAKDLPRVRFMKTAKNDTASFSRFFKNNTFPVQDIHNPEQIADVIVDALSSFKREIDVLAEVFPELLEAARKQVSDH